MKKILILLSICSLMIACSSTKRLSDVTITKENVSNPFVNDGSSYEKAIVINKKNESDGVAEEYKWLRQHYPGYTVEQQVLSFHKKKPYDILTILTAESAKKTIYFDISKFYGAF